MQPVLRRAELRHLKVYNVVNDCRAHVAITKRSPKLLWQMPRNIANITKYVFPDMLKLRFATHMLEALAPWRICARSRSYRQGIVEDMINITPRYDPEHRLRQILLYRRCSMLCPTYRLLCFIAAFRRYFSQR